MIVFLTLRAVVDAFLDGKLSAEDLTTADARFYFECARERLQSAEWNSADNPADIRRLVAILRAADAAGRVRWACGASAGVLISLAPSTRVFYRGQWHSAADLQPRGLRPLQAH